MTSKVGVLMDSFDPIRSAHLELCRSALSCGYADRVFLILSGEESSFNVSPEDRWKMLVSACAGSKTMIPLHFSSKKGSPDRDGILHVLRKKNPDDSFFFLSSPVRSGSSFRNSPDLLCPSVMEYCSVKGLYGFSSGLENGGPWLDRLFKDLNPHRFAHSLSVARTSVRLADRYGINVMQAETASLLHDCAKCLPLSEQRHIAEKHSLTEDPVILGSGSLLHSITGSWLAGRRYGVTDPEILKAIEYHNTGYPGMSRLAMCVCLADFIEPNREPFPLLEDVRRLACISLEKALLLSLEGVMAHVSSKGKSLHPRTVNTVAWLKSLPTVQSGPETAGTVS